MGLSQRSDDGGAKSTSVFFLFLFWTEALLAYAKGRNIADKTDQIIQGVPIVFYGEAPKPKCGVCEGQIYFNKTSELQPQFHFDEFPPAGVSQAVGGRAGERGGGGCEADRIFMIVIFVIIQQEKRGKSGREGEINGVG